jgi:hypothetical protein
MIIASRITTMIIASTMKIFRDPLEPTICFAELLNGAADPCGGTWGAVAMTGEADLACMKGLGGTCGGAESARFWTGEFDD